MQEIIKFATKQIKEQPKTLGLILYDSRKDCFEKLVPSLQKALKEKNLDSCINKKAPEDWQIELNVKDENMLYVSNGAKVWFKKKHAMNFNSLRGLQIHWGALMKADDIQSRMCEILLRACLAHRKSDAEKYLLLVKD